VYFGVIVIVVFNGVVPLFNAVNAGIFPVPVAADKPKVVFAFIQSYEVAVPVKLMAEICSLAHLVMSDVGVICGVGTTLIVCVLVLPGHTADPVVLAFASILTAAGRFEAFDRTYAGISPVPVSVVKPEIEDGTVADHEIVASEGCGVMVTFWELTLLQIVWSGIENVT